MTSALFLALVFGSRAAVPQAPSPAPMATSMAPVVVASHPAVSAPVATAVPETVFARMVGDNATKRLSIQEWGILVAMLSGIGGLIKIG